MLKVLPSALALVFSQSGWTQATINAGGAAGLPLNGAVVSGAATGSVSGTQLTVDQTTARAVLDWTSFNIDAGKSVLFNQPSVASAVLNRVNGDTNASQISGSLTANGTVMLMNPNGVMFGAGSVVNVGSLIATTGTIDRSAFESAGHANITGAAGSISNFGTIAATAGTSGLVALVAPSVVNQGIISASGGSIALGGATAATISLNGGLYEFAIPGGAGGIGVSNTASATLDAANIHLGVGDAANLLSGVINLEGVQQATNAIVVNGHTVELKSALQAPSVSGNSDIVNVSSGARIQDAVKITKTGMPGAGGMVNVGAGTYAEQVVLDKANMTMTGAAGARIVVPDSTEVNGVSIRANNVAVSGLEIAGPINQPYYQYYAAPAPSNISRGIVVADGVTGFTISNNNIHDVRTGVLLHGRNSNGSVTGNRIENTKSGISVQYTDGTGISMTGNTEGPVGNEWGVNLHLNGHLDGSGNILSNSTPISAAPTLGWQQSLRALSAANGGWSVQDQAYTSSNRTHVTVDPNGLASNQGSRLTPLNTLQAGVNAVVTDGIVNVAAGNHVQPSALVISKSLTLSGAGEASTTIDARSVSGYGIQVTADNVTLKDFTLYGPSANAASSYGIKVSPGGGASARLHNFTIRQVTVRGSGRAELDLNGVDGALIDRVTADGAPTGGGPMTQGAGIQLTDSANVTVRNSTTRNNEWGGLALYQANRHYNQQVDNITVEANNNFTEINPVYMQDESASRDFGALNIAGFDFSVRDATLDQYTWLQATRQKAFDFVVNEGSPSSSVVQGWNGATTTQEFYLGIGNLTGGGTQAMSISTTLNRAGSGADIRVGAGRYAEDVVVNSPYNLYFSGSTIGSLTLNTGAGGSGIGGTVTADGVGGFKFDAPVRLLGDTTLTTLGRDITFNRDIQNAGGVAQALGLIAGSGGTRGNVHMTTGGSAAEPLGQLDVSANQFSLAGTLWVKGYKIDALGNVTLSNNTLRAQDTGTVNTLNAGGNVTGSTISLGSVEVVSAGNIEGNFAGTNVVAQAQGAMEVVVTASRTASLTAETIVATVTATDVVAQSQGDMNMVATASNSASLAGDSVVATVTAPVVAVDAVSDAQISGSASQITLDAPRGSVTGNFGQVSNTGGGLVNVNGKPQGNQTLSSNAENNRVIRSGNALDDAASDQLGLQVAEAGGLGAMGEVGVGLSLPEAAGEAIDSGKAVELDLSPRRQREGRKEEEKDKDKPAKP